MVLPIGQFRFFYVASDYETAVSFYRDGLGLPVDHEWNFGPADRGIVFQAGGGMIEILGAEETTALAQPQGVSMLIQVESADQCYQLAQERGLAVVQEPTDFPWGHRIVRLRDPEGIIVSLFQVIQ